VSLIVLAVLSRLVWTGWVHPPQDHVFSDMAHYVYRARLVANWEIAPGQRAMAWQAWGTHALLAMPMILLGPSSKAALGAAALMWAGLSAATVVWSYRLALRVLPRADAGGPHWPAIGVGVAALLWFPLLSHAGFFVSETPFTWFLLASTLAIVTLIQTGRQAWRAGIWGALAFAVRPQVAVFFVLLGLAWLLDRRWRGPAGERGSWSRRVELRAALRFAAPLLIVLAISLVRVRVYTGAFGGVAENGAMNLTAGRCHNVVTRAFPDQAALEHGQPTRRISLPGFRALAHEGPDHPLALRPALGGESIDFVGEIGDREQYRAIRRRCYAATGVTEQLRYSVTNVAMLWVVARPWPESSDHRSARLLPVAMRGRDLAAWLAPLALLAMVLALWRWLGGAGAEADHEPIAGLGVCALQLVALLLTSAVFFGSPRLRTPSDPYALILLAALARSSGAWIAARLRRRPR